MITSDYSKTSDYLECVVDLDKPILLVGPGIQYITPLDPKKPERGLNIPQDIALLWFAEHLYGRKGRLDILDLPPGFTNTCCNGVDKIEEYVDKLKSNTNVGEIQFLLPGDVANYEFPTSEYGFIWDHRTLERWSCKLPGSKHTDNKLKKERRKKILQNYHNALSPGGKIAVGTVDPLFAMYLRVSNFFNSKVIQLKSDSYATQLTEVEACLSELNLDDVLKDGNLLPYHCVDRIVEIR